MNVIDFEAMDAFILQPRVTPEWMKRKYVYITLRRQPGPVVGNHSVSIMFIIILCIDSHFCGAIHHSPNKRNVMGAKSIS